ncbi:MULTISPECIES: hypothetical protein [Acidiplasma]|uniref:Uncharacterized protein n=2 Tax=Acidiplasma TaxID=507753 RepID=A0A0Q0VQY6_9ARCH|nr:MULTISPECIES: hypothetical protein [Acidiplasma]KQB33533.1 hypothetical protein AOG55_02730 [Acidiplasma cupricumulans]KQB33976.1 hypothetical protein AOG54_01570 [Acidiplasma aeolicum]
MDESDITKALSSREMTKEEIIEFFLGTPDMVGGTNADYIRIGSQILLENKIEFMINKLVTSGKIGTKKKSNGIIENIYYFVK